jgi:SAM-dependent methyltransferase
MSDQRQSTGERACPVCGRRDYRIFAPERLDMARVSAFTYSSRKLPEFMCLRLVRCLGCDLVYAPEPPSAKFLGTAYAGAAYDSGVEARAAAETYAAALAPHLSVLPCRSVAVDVGAGSGPLLPWLCQQGFETVIGIEPSLAAIAAAPPDVAPLLRPGVFSPDVLGKVEPSLICSFMTLEHLPDPADFMSSAFTALRPGGMIALVVHDWRAPLNRILGLRSPIIDIEHLQLFSARALAALLHETGFSNLEMRKICNRYPLRYWLRMTPLPAGSKTVLNAMIERLGLADRTLAMRVGNLFAVGRKPLSQSS